MHKNEITHPLLKRKMHPVMASFLLFLVVYAMLFLSNFILDQLTPYLDILFISCVLEVGIFVILTLFFFALSRSGAPFGKMTFKRTVLVTGMGITGYPVAILLALPLLVIWMLVSPTLSDPSAGGLIEIISQYPLWQTILVIAVTPAISEELLFRGAFMKGYAKKIGKAIILSALLFAMLHRQVERLHITFLLGLYIGWVVLRTGNVIYGMIIHFINNAMSVVYTKALDGVTQNLLTESSIVPQIENAGLILLGIGAYVIVSVGLFILFSVLLKNDTKKDMELLRQETELLPKEKTYFFSVVFNGLSILLLVVIMAVPYLEVHWPEAYDMLMQIVSPLILKG